MRCPNDGATLLLSKRQGVEIDYCPDCRGVWLDRGELDKLVSRVEVADRDLDHDGRVEPAKKRKKKSSFLQDLFEFGQE